MTKREDSWGHVQTDRQAAYGVRRFKSYVIAIISTDLEA